MSPKNDKTSNQGHLKSGYKTCQVCIKYEIRLQHVLKDKDEEEINNMKVSKYLAEENMQLRRERDSWKTLYHAKR